MSSITEKPHTMQPYLPSHSWPRCVALSAMALLGLGVGLWRSHLLEDASGLALLLFSSITLLTVGSAVLAVWVSQPYLDLQAKSRTEQLEPFSKPFGSVQASKSKTRRAAARVVAITAMVGLVLLAILPVVAIVKSSINASLDVRS